MSQSTVQRTIQGLSWFEVTWRLFEPRKEWLIVGIREVIAPGLPSTLVQDSVFCSHVPELGTHRCSVQAIGAEDAVTRANILHLGQGIR